MLSAIRLFGKTCLNARQNKGACNAIGGSASHPSASKAALLAVGNVPIGIFARRPDIIP